MSVAVDTAAAALAKVRDFTSDRFAALVFDERGRERSVEDLKRAVHQGGQDRASGKIEDQLARMSVTGASVQQKTDDQRLMNEMRGNKATLDFNRALFEYDHSTDEPAP